MLCPNCAFECREDAETCPNCSFPFQDMLGQSWMVAQTLENTPEQDIPTEFEPEEEKAPLPPVTKENTGAGGYESVSALQPLDPYALSIAQEPVYAEPYYQHQENLKPPTRYKTGIAICLLCAALLVVGAVALLAMSASGTQRAEEPEMQQSGVEALHGAWANKNDCVVFTLDGRFATTGDRGTFELSGTDMMLRGSDDFSVSTYELDEDKLTVTVHTFGKDKTFVYYHVSEQTNLSTSQIRELWDEYSRTHGMQED